MTNELELQLEAAIEYNHKAKHYLFEYMYNEGPIKDLFSALTAVHNTRIALSNVNHIVEKKED